MGVGIRYHTATSYYRVEAIAGVLMNVVSLMQTEVGFENFELRIESIAGHEKLSEEDRGRLETIDFQNSHPQRGTVVPEEPKSSTHGMRETDVKQDSEAKPKTKGGKSRRREQPKAGSKTGEKGRAEWKFAGRSCFGTLIPSMETKTHCYARTHKSNVKTLAKGKDY